MNLKYLPSLLFINITRRKKLFVGGTDLRRGGGGARKGRRSRAHWCQGEIHDWIDCLGLTVLTVDFYYFFPSNFRTMTDNCWTSNWWVNTSSDMVALTTKVAKMLRQSNKTDYFWCNLWVVDPGILSLIMHINTEAVSTDAKAATGQVRNLSIIWLPHLYNVTEQHSEKQHKESLSCFWGPGVTGGSQP